MEEAGAVDQLRLKAGTSAGRGTIVYQTRKLAAAVVPGALVHQFALFFVDCAVGVGALFLEHAPDNRIGCFRVAVEKTFPEQIPAAPGFEVFFRQTVHGDDDAFAVTNTDRQGIVLNPVKEGSVHGVLHRHRH